MRRGTAGAAQGKRVESKTPASRYAPIARLLARDFAEHVFRAELDRNPGKAYSSVKMPSDDAGEPQ